MANPLYLETAPIDLSALSAAAAELGANHDAFSNAVLAERDAEAKVLEAAIAAVKPALRALGSRIKSKNHSTSGRNGCNYVEEIEYFDTKGLRLCSSFSRDKDPTGNSGIYSGEAVYLLVDGTLARVTKSGTWSLYQGEWDREDYEIEAVTAREVMNRETLNELLEAISKAVTAQLGGKLGERTNAATARAQKLEAIASLARGK
jgi:hypothetical protein